MTATSFAELYENALTIKPRLQAPLSPLGFAGTFYEILPEAATGLLTILCGGMVMLPSGHSFLYQPIDCHLLLYTRNGKGLLKYASRSFSLEKDSLLYLDCSKASFSYETDGEDWHFSLFFLTGSQLKDYASLISYENPLIHPVSAYSALPGYIESLLSGKTGANLHNKLSDMRLLTDLLTTLLTEACHLESPAPACASYLVEIRQYFDTQFMLPFHLEDLEKRHHMSKYRICHEFSDTFGVPPLKYLNHKRLEKAAILLCATEKRVHEIALEVGYENTNHFINLFKKEFKTTPQAYRNAKREQG